MNSTRLTLRTPSEVSGLLANRLKALRLLKNWKRETLAKRAGVTLASLKRFENEGKASLGNLLKLAFAIGRLDDFEKLLQPPPTKSLAELEQKTSLSLPKRGRL